MRDLAMSIALFALLLLGWAGCKHGEVADGVRFANAPVAWAVDDRQHLPKPRDNVHWPIAYKLHYRIQPLTHAMSVPDRVPAQNVNALGEVPDSTWFHNRIGRGLLSPADVAAGPAGKPFPNENEPWTIVSAKLSGAAPGFVVEDMAGTRFLVKFDEPDVPEMESANEVITQRLLWALGFHVPINSVTYLDPARLRIGEGATTRDALHRELPFTRENLETELARAAATPQGTYRVFVSRYLPGEPIGGHSGMGIRDDDPNDHVPHQHRRELRAQLVFFGWLAHTDLKPDNRLDVWVEDPERPGRHFVMHYLLDFGKSLGAFGTAKFHPSDTYAYNFDYKFDTLSLFALGLWKRPWEGYYEQPHPFIGRIDVEHYRPGRFRGYRPYEPMFWLDEVDAWWAVKTLLRLSREHIEAAVEQGKFSDPRANEILVDILVGRQRKAARYFLRKVNPIGDVVLKAHPQGPILCAEDLWLRYRLGRDHAPREHTATVHDFEGRRLSDRQRLRPAEDGWFCTAPLPTSPSRDHYTVVGLGAKRQDDEVPTIWVHLATDPDTGTPRIIGINRP